jgi:hypothetical protein
VARIVPRRPWSAPPHRAVRVDAARGNAPCLGGLVVRGKEMRRGLVAAKLVLQGSTLVPRTVELLLESSEPLEYLAGHLRREGRFPTNMFLERTFELREAHVALASRGRRRLGGPCDAKESEVGRLTEVYDYVLPTAVPPQGGRTGM